MKNYGFVIEKEFADQSEKDWLFSSASTPCIALIPHDLREKYLPEGEVQFGEDGDMNDCATRSVINIYETKFTYLYKNLKLKAENKKWLEDNGYVVDGKVVFSDAFIAILSGTTPRGNSLKAPIEAARVNGLIPKPRLPFIKSMSWDEYHNPNRITEELRALGKEFLRRFVLNYERVDNGAFEQALDLDLLDIAVFGWPTPKKGEYPRDERPFTHAAIIFKKPMSYAFDNYIDETDGDFVKKLASDFKFFDYGYRIYISQERLSEEQDIQLTVFATLLKFNLLSYFADWWQRFKNPTIPALPVEVVPPSPIKPVKETTTEKILAQAELWLGKEPTPDDKVPDEVSCVYSLVKILRPVVEIDPTLTYTPFLVDHLTKSKAFKLTNKPEAGSIIVSPTVGKRVGHCGIFLTENRIASNNSFGGIKGLWTDNYSYPNWIKSFEKDKKLKTFIFKAK